MTPHDGRDTGASNDAEQAPELTSTQRALVKSVEGMVEKRVAWHLSQAPGAIHLADDLAGIGQREVAETSRRFSPKFGTSFKTYVRYAVDGAILDAIARDVRERSFVAAAEAALRFGALAHAPADDEALDPMQDDEREADRKLRRALSRRAMSAAMAFTLQLEHRFGEQRDPERAAALCKLRDVLRDAVCALAPRDQEMLRLLYAEGLELAEIAERLGLAYPTVKVRHAKMLGVLREALAARGISSGTAEE